MNKDDLADVTTGFVIFCLWIWFFVRVGINLAHGQSYFYSVMHALVKETSGPD